MAKPTDMPTIILMIEQDQHQIDRMYAALKEIWCNVHVHKIDSVGKAIDYLFRKGRESETLTDPDLVILGALTPATEVIHILSVIRKSQKLQNLPVVAMTVLEQVNYKNIAERLGVALVLPQSQIKNQTQMISSVMIDCWFEGGVPIVK